MDGQSAEHSTVSVYMVTYEAPRIIDFMRDVFGGEVLMRLDREDGTVRHASVLIDDSTIMITDGQPHMPSFPVWLHVYVDDVDAVYQAALDYGAESVQEPADQEDGDRRAGVKDSSGNIWWIAATAD